MLKYSAITLTKFQFKSILPSLQCTKDLLNQLILQHQLNFECLE